MKKINNRLLLVVWSLFITFAAIGMQHIEARGQTDSTTYGCYIASPPHILTNPGDTRIVSSPSDCVANETSISWDVFPVGASPASVGFDGANIWVSNQGSNTVTKIRANDGANLGTFPAGPFPGKIIFDGVNIWITNFTANTLTKLRASDGALLATIPVRQAPAGLSFDGTNLWVSFYNNNSVSKIRLSDGAELGNTPGVFSPLELLFDGANIWAANNTGGGKITKLSASTGAILGVFNTNGGFPSVLAFDGSNLWVPNSGTQSVSKIRGSDGAVVGAFAMGFGSAGVAFDGTNMWLANEDVILKYRPSDGAVLGSFPGSFNGSGRYETAVVFDGTSIWVANYTANTVTRYRDGGFDSIAPSSLGTSNPAANASGWNHTNVNVTLTATDNNGGSGVKEIIYSASGAQPVAQTTIYGAAVNLMIAAEGETTITFYAVDNAANAETAQTLVVRVDKTAPVINSAAEAGGSPYASGSWTNKNIIVSFDCTDALSGVANVTQPVTISNEGTNQLVNGVCTDSAGNTSNTDFSNIKIDKTPPVINMSAPTNGNYLLNQSVTVSFDCADSLSGVSSCTGTSTNGSLFDTASIGAKTFSVNAADNAANSASTVTINYSVNFGVVALFDQTKSHKSGSTIPIKIRLVDANGLNLSSAGTLVHALNVVQISSQASTVLDDAGNSNPDFDFRYDQNLGGYIFNLKTTGYETGAYLLKFIAGSNSSIYSIGFQVRQ